MKTFEIFNESKKGQNGRRKFKVILYQIYPDNCVDEENEVGTKYNLNGITWLREYCEKALPSIKGMSLRCEFLDEERTELCGHGMTDIVDGVPIFENATVIGTFQDGYIEDVELSDGEKITACIGVGEIDSSCYHNLCEKLDENIEKGIFPCGSVEIMKTTENNGIVYKYGYKENGRIPTEFIHSGYALLGIAPSDKTAKLVELNEHKEEIETMTEAEIKALIEQVVSTYTNQVAKINECENDCKDKVEELNKAIETISIEKNELAANSEQIQKALDDIKKEYEELDKQYHDLYEERKALEEALGQAKAKERLGELAKAISEFTDEEKAYAKTEIEEFEEDPNDAEIEAVVNKILIGIGKKAREEAAAIVSEQNAAKSNSVEDIFSVVDTTVASSTEDTNIF